MNEIQIFNFHNNEVRVVNVNNEPWFVAKEVAAILGYSETNRMTARLDDDEKSKIKSTVLVGLKNVGNNDVTIINESGLYNAVLGSTKPNAKRFRKWVTGEVLPSIRKTGKFAVATTMPSPEVLMATLCDAIERASKAEAEREKYKRNLQRIARASKLNFGEISNETGLPKDIVVASHCKSNRRRHKPQYGRYIQLMLPLRELVEEYYRIENDPHCFDDIARKKHHRNDFDRH